MKTFAQLRASVIESIFPEGEPESLVIQHTKQIVLALIDLQDNITRLQSKNTTTHRMCANYFWCGATVVPAPRGVIRSVYTLLERTACCPIFYDYIESHDRFIDWLQGTRTTWTKPTQPASLPELQHGMLYAGAETDKGYRYNWGNWNLHNGRIYAGHRIESDEILCVEWSGIKRRYEDSDIIDFGGDVEDANDDGFDVEHAIGLFVLSNHETIYGRDPKMGAHLMQEYRNKRAELYHRYRSETIPEDKPRREYIQPIVATDCAAPDCVAEDEESAMFFALVGDTGMDLVATANVATMVESWGPQFIVSLGDNWNNTGASTMAMLDDTFGQFYRTFLYPYRGTSGPQSASEQRFFGAIGNHDRDPEGRLDMVRDFLNLPPSSGQPNKGYYDFVKGHVHFFMVDSGYSNSNINQQDDGVSSTSVQANWLRQRLAASKSLWKVVIVHHPPYSSYVGGGGADPFDEDGFRSYPALRWPFKEWGADVVVSGHNHQYERLVVDGMTYIVAGTGGSTLVSFDEETVSQYSVTRHSQFGATKVFVTCEYMLFQHYDYDGTLVEQFSLTKPDAAEPTEAPGITEIPDLPGVPYHLSTLVYNAATGQYHRLLLDTDETTGALQLYPDPSPVS